MKYFAPGPKGKFLFGCFAEFRDHPLQLLAECRSQYGPLVQLPVGFNQSFCLVFAPEDLDIVFGDNSFGRSDIATAFKPLAGGSMIIADGESWRAQRKTVIPSFAGSRLRSLAPKFEDIAKKRVATWGNKTQIDLQQEMTTYAMSVLSEILFGHQMEQDAIHRISHWWPVSLRYMNIRLSQPIPLPDWLPTLNNLRLNHAADQIAKVLLEIIRQHRCSAYYNADCFLDDLINYRDEVTGIGLSDEQILREMMGLFLAGFDTVACGMMWTLHALAQNPEWQKTVLAELLSPISDRQASPFLDRVYNESLRLNPPLWLVDRKAKNETVLGDFRIPAGTNIITSPWVTHRDPQFWPDPERFDPNRFASSQAQSRPHYAYFPFGGGQMKCIGIGLAKLELNAIVSAALEHFELRVDPEARVEIEPVFVLRTRSGIPIHLHRR